VASSFFLKLSRAWTLGSDQTPPGQPPALPGDGELAPDAVAAVADPRELKTHAVGPGENEVEPLALELGLGVDIA
jgi:hypothetical protein